MNATTFQRFRDLIYRSSGICLVAGKEALVRARVGSRMRKLGMADEGKYLKHVLQDSTGDEIVQLLDAISTNVTYFFREPDHFDLLAECAAQWWSEGRSRLRIWSAACSSGEEPYSIAMTLLDLAERLRRPIGDVKILGTDLSTRVLAAARVGQYEAETLQQLPKTFERRFFSPAKREGSFFEINESVKQLIGFRRLNLATPPFPMNGTFDAILCRNVMIYFDDAVRGRLVREMERLLAPGGVLLIGHSESLSSVPTRGLRVLRPSVYEREASADVREPVSRTGRQRPVATGKVT